MIYLIGLGLHDEDDISVKGLKALKRCYGYIYVEFYTNEWRGNLSWIKKELNKDIDYSVREYTVSHLKREDVESDFLIKRAAEHNTALLIPGDPLAATTHIDLLARAKRAGIEVKVIHASSVLTAVAECGLQLYKFGRTTTLPKPEKGFVPTSPYEIIAQNQKSGLHSLVLLDISLSAKQGLNLLLETEEKLKLRMLSKKTKVVACAVLGGSNQVIKYGTVEELMKAGIGERPACLIVPGKLHFSEEEVLELYKV